MGIDVSGSFQAKDGNRWIPLQQYYCGRRGLLRWWLGWGRGGLYEKFGGQPLVDEPRGLPIDLRKSDYVETDRLSWVLADEVLGALPLLGRCTYLVPLELAHSAWEQRATPKQWKQTTGISDELDFLEPYGGPPRIVSVAPIWSTESNLKNSVSVECVYDFSDEIREFIDEVEKLQKLYEVVRFVYEFE